VDMPIVSALGHIVNDGANPVDVVSMLMGRELKSEVPEPALRNFLENR